MRIRNGYVSNSSSSSFIVMFNNVGDFNALKKSRKHYRQFSTDISNGRNATRAKAMEFFQIEYESIMRDVEWEVAHPNCVDFSGMTPEQRYRGVCDSIGVWNDELSGLYRNGKKAAEKAVKEKRMFGADQSRRAKKFASIMLEEAKKKWSRATVLSYSDECGDFGGEMEHEFMWLVGQEASKSGGAFAVISRSEH